MSVYNDSDPDDVGFASPDGTFAVDPGGTMPDLNAMWKSAESALESVDDIYIATPNGADEPLIEFNAELGTKGL